MFLPLIYFLFQGDLEANDSSDSDSIMSDFGDDKPEVRTCPDAMARLSLIHWWEHSTFDVEHETKSSQT